MKRPKQTELVLRESEDTETGADSDIQEAVSLRDRETQIRAAFRSAHRDPFNPGREIYWDMEVFETFVVARKAGHSFRSNFTEKNGAFVFGPLETVEVEFKPTPGPNPPPAVEGVSAPVMESETEADAAPEDFRESEILGNLVEAEDGKGFKWAVTVIEGGHTKERTLPDGTKMVRNYTDKALADLAKLSEGLEVFAFSGQEHAETPGKKGVRDSVGFLESVKRTGKKVVAVLNIYKDAAWLRDRLVGLNESGNIGRIGLSIDAGGKGKVRNENGLIVQDVLQVTNASSVDVVYKPAAGGRVERLVASQTEEITMDLEKILAMIRDLRPELLEGRNTESMEMAEAEALLKEAMTPPVAPDPEPPPAETPDVTVQESGAKDAATEAERLLESIRENERVSSENRARSEMDVALKESELPEPVQADIRARFADTAPTAKKVAAAIKSAKAMLVSLTESDAIPATYGGGEVEVSQDERDKVLHMVEAMFWSGPNDRQDPRFPEHLRGVKPFRSIKAAHEAVTGRRATANQIWQESQFSLPGFDTIGDPDRAARFYESVNNEFNGGRLTESVISTTWAELLGDNLRKRMQAEYSYDPLNSWRKIVSDIGAPTDFRTNRRMKMGGYGVLPTVSEQGTYQSLTSPGDTEETYSVVKFGGLEDLTFETIRNDDVGAVRRIPVKLGRAAALTVYRRVWDKIEDNTALADAVALIHTTHANDIGGTALSNAGLTTGRRLMIDQTAYGDSSDILGVGNAPRWLVVPSELEETAYQLTRGWAQGQGEHDTTNRNTNFHGSYGLDYIVVEYYAVATDYWLVADPANTPTMEVGFLDGREEPEIFVQDAPAVGSTFSADKITYKVRIIAEALLLDYRGFAGEIA